MVIVEVLHLHKNIAAQMNLFQSGLVRDSASSFLILSLSCVNSTRACLLSSSLSIFAAASALFNFPSSTATMHAFRGGGSTSPIASLRSIPRCSCSRSFSYNWNLKSDPLVYTVSQMINCSCTTVHWLVLFKHIVQCKQTTGPSALGMSDSIMEHQGCRWVFKNY